MILALRVMVKSGREVLVVADKLRLPTRQGSSTALTTSSELSLYKRIRLPLREDTTSLPLLGSYEKLIRGRRKLIGTLRRSIGRKFVS